MVRRWGHLQLAATSKLLLPLSHYHYLLGRLLPPRSLLSLGGGDGLSELLPATLEPTLVGGRLLPGDVPVGEVPGE